MLNALKGIYCDFGLPIKVLSDNGPCFRAEEFVEFHTKLGINSPKKTQLIQPPVCRVCRVYGPNCKTNHGKKHG